MKKLGDYYQDKGITLIALVVTIIVLLILAGISIGMIMGENGIIKRASDAKLLYENAAINEDKDMQNIDEIIKNGGYYNNKLDFPSLIIAEYDSGAKINSEIIGNKKNNDYFTVLTYNQGDYDESGLLYFDLSKYNINADNVEKVELYAYYYYSDIPDRQQTHPIRKVTSSWNDESLLTYDMMSDDPEGLMISVNQSGYGYGWRKCNITNMAKEWIRNPTENYGVVIDNNRGQSNGGGFWSAMRYYTTEFSRVYAPKIIIKYKDDSPIDIGKKISLNSTQIGTHVTTGVTIDGYNDDWYILEKDDANIKLLYGDYLPYSSMPLDSESINNNNKYNVWSTANQTDMMRYLTNENGDWNELSDAFNKELGLNSISAVGTPTMEQIENTGVSRTTTNWINPHYNADGSQTWNSCYGYWLSTKYETNNLRALHFQGTLLKNDSVYNCTGLGVRPVVNIPIYAFNIN